MYTYRRRGVQWGDEEYIKEDEDEELSCKALHTAEGVLT